MRYVILGGLGQLGAELAEILDGEVWVASKVELDLTKTYATIESLAAYAPDMVINCAAYNEVDGAETEYLKAMAVNAYGPAALAKFCQARGIRLVHFSTDQVFGGISVSDERRCRPYRTKSFASPVNMYGVSKLAGEVLVRANCANHLIIRTCGLYSNLGRGKTPFVERVLVAGKANLPIYAVYDQLCTPTYARNLADVVVTMIEERQHSGTYHVTNKGSCSWYMFSRRLFDIAGISVDLRPVSSATWREMNPMSARRPLYSVLDSFATPQMPHWTEALEAYLKERRNLWKI